MYHQTADGCPRNAGNVFSLGGIGDGAAKSATAIADLEDCALIREVRLWEYLKKICARRGVGWSYDLAMMNLSQWAQSSSALKRTGLGLGGRWFVVSGCCWGKRHI